MQRWRREAATQLQYYTVCSKVETADKQRGRLMALATFCLCCESFRLYTPSTPALLSCLSHFDKLLILLDRIIITIKRIPWICEIKIKIQDKKEVTANSVSKKAHNIVMGNVIFEKLGEFRRQTNWKNASACWDWQFHWKTEPPTEPPPECSFFEQNGCVKSSEFTWVKQKT